MQAFGNIIAQAGHCWKRVYEGLLGRPSVQEQWNGAVLAPEEMLLCGLFFNHHFQMSGDVLVQLYRDAEFAERFQRFMQLDFPPVNIKAFLGEGFCDIAGRN